MNDEEILNHLKFLMAGGSIDRDDWDNLSHIQEEMEEAGRRFIAYRSCTEAMASFGGTPLARIWSQFDGGATLEKALVNAAACQAQENLKAMIERASYE